MGGIGGSRLREARTLRLGYWKWRFAYFLPYKRRRLTSQLRTPWPFMKPKSGLKSARSKPWNLCKDGRGAARLEAAPAGRRDPAT